MTTNTITIAIDDLETLIFASGALKDVENAMASASRDIQILGAKHHLSAARDRLASAMRAAQREQVFQAPNQADINRLRELEESGAGLKPLGIPVDCQSERYRECQTLMLKGLVELGTYREVVMWGSSGDVSTKDRPLVQQVRLTARGKAALDG